MMDSAYIFQLSHEEAAHKRHWAINNARRRDLISILFISLMERGARAGKRRNSAVVSPQQA